MAHDVFGHDPWDKKLQQIISPARLGPAAAHLESAKGMPPYDRAGAGTIDINIAGDQFGFDPLDIRGAAREKSSGQRVINPVGHLQRFVETRTLITLRTGPKSLRARAGRSV